MGVPEIYQEIEGVLGPRAARRLAEHFGGQQVYFPVWDKARQERDHAIRRDQVSEGLSVSELSEKYGLSARRIRQILRADGESQAA
ncbi:MAG: Mor transcription activator family protein [Thermodesulfobacteriota bacterium]|nr:Mor transcription activator family protein [Thermodesulfobacteriota bacterium]